MGRNRVSTGLQVALAIWCTKGMQQEGRWDAKRLQEGFNGVQRECEGDTTEWEGAAMMLQHEYKGDTTRVQEEMQGRCIGMK